MERVPGKPLSRSLGVPSALTLLDRLLSELNTWQSSCTVDDCHEPISLATLSDREKASFILEEQQLGELLERYWPPNSLTKEQIERFVQNGDLSNVNREMIIKTLGTLPGTLQHGDLHADNVIVDERGGAQIGICLIDWSRYGVKPLGSDYARLESQIRLRAVGKHNCSCYEMDQVKAWLKFDGLLHNDVRALSLGSGDPSLNPWDTYIRNIRTNALNQIKRAGTDSLSQKLIWWYYFSLFCDYLTAFGYGYLPAAKRVWAICSAANLGKVLSEKL
jgi:hypothetical protein